MSAHKTPLTQNEDPPEVSCRIAFISDIHGNLDALEAVLEDLEEQNISSVLCLGDIVGYGPEPGACVRRIREHCDYTVLGNHELMMLMLHSGMAADLGPELTPALRRALHQLTAKDREWISALPLGVNLEEFAIVHSSFFEPPIYHYIMETEDAEACIRDQPAPVSFHGHTHVPMIWEKNGKAVYGVEPGNLPTKLNPNARYCINVGSVGQPRDGDSRAAYCIFDPLEKTVTHRRVIYDIAWAQTRFEGTGLRNFDRQRIALGD
ncbi:MAG: metallophosphoesterase family protein [Verrucomicrobia bacterium]|nr:metallophosphoesterase family protein [Verrucomicrobiota bacterium]MCH8510431.1 metallophosphatase family protein [Kiritimatiellia bacterium]